MAAVEQTYDLIAIGRAGIDLYGEQVGGRLEDMASFAKYAGGSYPIRPSALRGSGFPPRC